MTDTELTDATRAWPDHDPATKRTVPESSVPVDQDRVEKLMAQEWERFSSSTTGSSAHHARALGTLPLGVTSSFQYWEPHPIAIESAKGAWLTDVDGRQLLDLSMGFGAMLVGHLHPLVVEYVTKALESGTLFVTPSPSATSVAELFQKRFNLEQLRFANSGTEATMYAVKAARVFTGRRGSSRSRVATTVATTRCRYRSSQRLPRPVPRNRRFPSCRSRPRPASCTWFLTTTWIASKRSSPNTVMRSRQL